MVSKPRLVFVPGLGATGETYRPFLKRLTKEYDVRVAVHGLRFPETLRWQFFFDAIDAAASGTRRFYLLGHSLGGATAIAYAAVHPQRVIRTVAVASPLFPVARVADMSGLKRFWFYRRLSDFALAAFGGHPLHGLRTAQVRKRRLAGRRRQRLYDWANAIDLSPYLPKLRSGIVLWMAKEELLSPRMFERLHREFPEVPTAVIPGKHSQLALAPWKVFDPVREALRG